MARKYPLFTIGYEGTNVAAFVATLSAAGVDRLVDVRDRPQSRKPGFSKTGLGERLAEAAIGYHHAGALGTPKTGRDAMRAGERARFLDIFSARLETVEAQMALAELTDMAKRERVCLMCFERDHDRCHRAIVADHIARDTSQRIVPLVVEEQ